MKAAVCGISWVEKGARDSKELGVQERGWSCACVGKAPQNERAGWLHMMLLLLLLLPEVVVVDLTVLTLLSSITIHRTGCGAGVRLPARGRRERRSKRCRHAAITQTAACSSIPKIVASGGETCSQGCRHAAVRHRQQQAAASQPVW